MTEAEFKQQLFSALRANIQTTEGQGQLIDAAAAGAVALILVLTPQLVSFIEAVARVTQSGEPAGATARWPAHLEFVQHAALAALLDNYCPAWCRGHGRCYRTRGHEGQHANAVGSWDRA